MGLDDLPPEIALQIFSFLNLLDLRNLCLLSRSWCAFFRRYESTIYRQAAYLYGFINDQGASLDSKEIGEKYSKRVMKNVDSWKALCRSCYLYTCTIHGHYPIFKQANGASLCEMHGTVTHLL